MSLPAIMWMCWGVVATALLSVMLYKSGIERYEEDGMYLNSSQSDQAMEFSTAVDKVKRLQPWLRGLGGAAGALTAALLVFYVVGAIREL